jgi:hypothetical protein
MIELEEDRPAAPALRQIREWYKQERIALCMYSYSVLENPRLIASENEDAEKDTHQSTITGDIWNRKMILVGLENIEMRSAGQRSYSLKGEVHVHTFDFSLDQLLMREIHRLLFPNIDFDLSEYFRSLGLEPIPMNSTISLTEPSNIESTEQWLAHRKWNNAKGDSLSLNAFSTWSSPDDVFVTQDKNFLRKRDKLKEPFVLTYRTKVRAPTSETEGYLEERTITQTICNVIPGQILSPLEAVEYLRKRLELSS